MRFVPSDIDVHVILVGDEHNALLQAVLVALRQSGGSGGYEWESPTQEGQERSPAEGIVRDAQGTRTKMSSCLNPELSARWAMNRGVVGHVPRKDRPSVVVYLEDGPMAEPVLVSPADAPMVALTANEVAQGDMDAVAQRAVGGVMALCCHLAACSLQDKPRPAIQTRELSLAQWFALGQPAQYWWRPKDDPDSPVWPCVKLGETQDFQLYSGRIRSISAGDYLVQVRGQPREFGAMGYAQHELGYPTTQFSECPLCQEEFPRVGNAMTVGGLAIRHINESHPELIYY